MKVNQQLLREVLRHTEAANRVAFAMPPVAESSRYAQWTEMIKDPTVAGCLETIKNAILARPWYIKPGGDTARAAAVAQWTQEMLKAAQIETALEEALSALWRGFAVHEIVWRYEKPLFVLDPLAAVSPEQIAFELDEKMRVVSIVSRPMNGPESRIPAEKVWLHRYRGSRSHPAGLSILDAAYRPWFAKDQILRFWGLAIQRYGMPLFIVQVPETLSDDQSNNILNAFYNLRLDGVALVPDTVAYQKHDPQYSQNIAFAEAVHYHDAQIRLALLLNFTMGTVVGKEYVTGQGLQEMAKVAGHRMARIGRDLCDCFGRQVLAPLVRANFGEDSTLVPQLVLPLGEPGEMKELAETWIALAQAGVVTAEEARAAVGLE